MTSDAAFIDQNRKNIEREKSFLPRTTEIISSSIHCTRDTATHSEVTSIYLSMLVPLSLPPFCPVAAAAAAAPPRNINNVAYWKMIYGLLSAS